MLLISGRTGSRSSSCRKISLEAQRAKLRVDWEVRRRPSHQIRKQLPFFVDSRCSCAGHSKCTATPASPSSIHGFITTSRRKQAEVLCFFARASCLVVCSRQISATLEFFDLFDFNEIESAKTDRRKLTTTISR